MSSVLLSHRFEEWRGQHPVHVGSLLRPPCEHGLQKAAGSSVGDLQPAAGVCLKGQAAVPARWQNALLSMTLKTENYMP